MFRLKTLETFPIERRLVIPIGAVTPRPGLLEPFRDVTLTAAVMRRVDGDREGVVARVDRALRHFIHEVVTAPHIELEYLHIVGAFGHGLEARL